MGLSSIIGVAGAAVKGISAFSASRYRAKVAANNAEIYRDNADRVLQEASVEAQDNDVRAVGEIGQLLASQGASGIDMTSGSSLRSQVSAYKLAARDRGYTIARGEAASVRMLQGAQDSLAEARQARSAGVFSLLGSALGIGTEIVNNRTRTLERERASLIS